MYSYSIFRRHNYHHHHHTELLKTSSSSKENEGVRTSMAFSSSSPRDPRFTEDEDDDDDECEEVPEDKLPLSSVLRIGKEEKSKEENTRKDSDGERVKRMKGRPMRVKDYVKYCAVIKDRMIDVGDIVWVKECPDIWWPGWVQKRGRRKATVSFFGSNENSCKFMLSEVVYSFEEHFVSIPKPISEELSYAIDCALKEFGRRFVLGVMCPCLISLTEKANDGAFVKTKKKKKNEFHPTVVLRFVLGRAVSACVDHARKLSGAKKGAQVYAFRRFVYVLTDDEKYRQEMRLSESDISSMDDEAEPNTTDNIADEEMSWEMVSEDSYKEKGTFSPPTSDLSSVFQKEHFLNPTTMPCALPLSVDGHLSSNIAQLQPSETSSRSKHPTSLHMKFPQDFKLPSKDELMEEFNQFGKLDSSKTKVFIETDSVQLSFVHKLDAEAAFQYAKRDNTLFGGADVQFWLDPHEDPRRTTAIAPPLPSLTIGSPALKLKSCLRKPDAHGKEDKIERNKGKCLPKRGTTTIAPPLPFPTVESPALKLKSCVRTPDAHGKEDKIEQNNGKCLPGSRASSLPPSKKNDRTCKPFKSCNSSREVEPDISKPFLVLLLICQQIVNELLGTKDEKGKGI